jgi:PPM family protein phosphatase
MIGADSKALRYLLPPPTMSVRDEISTLSSSADPRENKNSWQVAVDYTVISDLGMRRANNQDSATTLLADSKSTWEKYGHLFMVADGMGAHAAGELASKMAVDRVPHHYRKLPLPLAVEAIQQAVVEANSEIFRRGQANAEFRNMGTTASVLLLLPEGAVAAHVGDSRVYRVRGDFIEQLTFDHSLVWEMRAAGDVSEESARSGLIPKNVITRSLGPNPVVQVDLEGPFPIQKGDRYLLCSDGLTGLVTDEEIGAMLQAFSAQKAGQALVDLANLRGGPDNITIVIAEVIGKDVVTSSSVTPHPRMDANQGKRRISTALVVVTVICLLASALFAVMSNFPLAIVAGVLGAIAMVTGIAQSTGSTSDYSDATQYGRGPYRKFNCRADMAFVERLKGTMQALREASQERKWKLNWQMLDALCKQGDDAASKGDLLAAVRSYGSAIMETMGQIRKQGSDRASDSGIDY